MIGAARSVGRVGFTRADLVIRPAQSADRPALEAIAARIWDGHDYLPRVFDDWVADQTGGFWVAVVHGQVVGAIKLTCHSPGQWWLEGLRVDPARQGRGIGRILHHFATQQARHHAPGVVRYSTASGNGAMVHRFAPETGFQQVAAFVPYGAEAEPHSLEGLTLLKAQDVGRAWTFLEQVAPHFEATQHTLEESWSFLPLTRELLAGRLAMDLVYGWMVAANDPDALAGLVVLNGKLQKSQGRECHLAVGYLDAITGQLTPLAWAARGLAARLGYERVSLKALKDQAYLDDLTVAGYERRWQHDVLLFTRNLSLTEGG